MSRPDPTAPTSTPTAPEEGPVTTTTSTPTPTSAAPRATTASLRRTLLLGRTNWTLMLRNRTTLLYAFLMPALPLVLLVVGTRGGQEANIDPSAGVLASVLLLALVFPAYYNVLSMFVTRRDELVLKRLRTGEIRDRELLVSMALPGVAVVLAVMLVSVAVAAALGLPLPGNPLLLLVAVLLSVVTFAAFAFWTAAWTKTAEAAQLTSGPIIALALVGLAGPALPASWATYVDLTPGAAVDLLLRLGWFGQDGAGATTGAGFVDTWAAAGQPLLVLVAWTAIAVALARRSLHWEPRA